ncbi:MAG: hypothetical protein D6702_00035 [Planctomycetota bacterium]|nr:MAG: hypothetical protein D6702_00035 [Planctomycetota bacterium]
MTTLPRLLLLPLAAAPVLLAGAGTAAPRPAAGPPTAAPVTFRIDPVHSWILFRTRHLGIGTAWGSFRSFSGDFRLDPDDPAAASVRIEIEAESVTTGNARRDDHLRGPDFFNVREFPTIRFRSTAVEGGPDEFLVRGQLELLGRKKEIEVAMHKVGEGKDPWGGYRAGFDGEFRLNRTDFGMDFMKEGLGPEVTVVLAFEGVRE